MQKCLTLKNRCTSLSGHYLCFLFVSFTMHIIYPVNILQHFCTFMQISFDRDSHRSAVPFPFPSLHLPLLSSSAILRISSVLLSIPFSTSQQNVCRWRRTNFT